MKHEEFSEMLQKDMGVKWNFECSTKFPKGFVKKNWCTKRFCSRKFRFLKLFWVLTFVVANEICDQKTFGSNEMLCWQNDENEVMYKMNLAYLGIFWPYLAITLQNLTISGQSFAWLCDIEDITEICPKYSWDMTSGMICIVS